MKDKHIHLCGHAIGLLDYVREDFKQLKEYLKFTDTVEADIQNIQHTLENIRRKLHNGEI